MVSVIIVEDEYPDLTTIFEDRVTYDIAGVYHIINTMTVGSEIAYDLKNHKDITEADIENKLQNYFSGLIDSLMDEVMEKLENCEGCTCDKIDGKWIFNKTEKDKTKELVDKIIDDEDDCIIEYACTETININNNDMKPVGEFAYMIEFFSTFLINEEEKKYQGDFGHNGRYIADCFTLMEDTQRRAIEIEEKYSHLGVKVTLGDFNTGCQYGMATYVWVPLQE